MAIQKWHWGKLVLLWAWGVGVGLVILQIVVKMTKEDFVQGLLLIGVLLLILFALSAVTWKWLGGKEQ